jgi:hypothetical protein
MTNLTVEGERYKGIFDAEMNTEKKPGCGEYSSSYYAYWYSGTGIIKDKKNKKKYVFSLCTETKEERHCSEGEDFFKKNYTLEESIVYFNQKGSIYWFENNFIPQLVPGKYAKIVDLCLEKIISKIKESKKAIPTIEPGRIKPEEMIERGLCFDKEGQIHLPFKGN